MGTDSTKRYVNDVLELAGLKGKSLDTVAKRLRVSDAEILALKEELEERASDHHSKNWVSIASSLAGERQPKGALFESHGVLPEIGTSGFMKRAALYYNKLLVEDPLNFRPPGRISAMTALGKRSDCASKLSTLLSLEPWITGGFVELVPVASLAASVSGAIWDFAILDGEDPEWHECVHDYMRQQDAAELKMCFSRELVASLGSGDPTLAASKLLALGASHIIGRSHLVGGLTDSLPITDRHQMWELYQLWISRRMAAEATVGTMTDSFVREAKAGRVWLALDAKELTVLDKLEPRKILEIRNSSEYSFQVFRNDLGKAVDEIRGTSTEDELAYREAANQAWDKVRASAAEIRKDRPKIETRLAVDGVVTVSGAALSLGLAPIAPGYAFTSAMATAVGPGRDFIKSMIDRQTMKKSSGYFLLKVEEAGDRT